ncbi:hypothetical protein AGDE_13065 [Angomonas deanei]|uniref:Uncharacterized protein n=1 Tax=Angomonas deanei TaxID=59799 RepID=A0A7G2CCA9_9TRYP|nr:hypothetical protein AGDE_13065 [Angomonas deanei]CAD2215712.1 hypothetical protein, conserved [Angomonas deanei]|eukprot:EPY23077.1 hypothetical protein AGDE_13065 [Angomonas deanei]
MSTNPNRNRTDSVTVFDLGDEHAPTVVGPNDATNPYGATADDKQLEKVQAGGSDDGSDSSLKKGKDGEEEDEGIRPLYTAKKPSRTPTARVWG